MDIAVTKVAAISISANYGPLAQLVRAAGS
jgi:hypothetical protein